MSEKVQGYVLLAAHDRFTLSELVNELLLNGWSLYGSPSMSGPTELDKTEYAQAMVWRAVDDL